MDPRGPKPLDKPLKRALFEEIDDFFQPARHDAAAEARGQSFQEFVVASRQRQADGVGPRSGAVGNNAAVRLWWLPNSASDDLRRSADGFLEALLAPVPLQAEAAAASTALGRAAAATNAKQGGQALLDALARQVPADALLSAVVRSGNAATTHIVEGTSAVITLGRSEDIVPSLVYLATVFLGILGLTACGFYECLLNSSGDGRHADSTSVVLRVCPVCLRKLGYALGERWDVARHYQGLLGWFEQEGFADEANWYRERLQTITERMAPEPRKPNRSPFDAGNEQPRSISAPHGDDYAPRDNEPSTNSRPAHRPCSEGPAERSCDWAEVTIAGFRGQHRALNGTYKLNGSCCRRPAFSHVENGRGKDLFLYYLRTSDSWVLGPELSSEAVWADCGPTSGGDFVQTWRLMDSSGWIEDSGVTATPLNRQPREGSVERRPSNANAARGAVRRSGLNGNCGNGVKTMNGRN